MQKDGAAKHRANSDCVGRVASFAAEFAATRVKPGSYWTKRKQKLHGAFKDATRVKPSCTHELNQEVRASRLNLQETVRVKPHPLRTTWSGSTSFATQSKRGRRGHTESPSIFFGAAKLPQHSRTILSFRRSKMTRSGFSFLAFSTTKLSNLDHRRLNLLPPLQLAIFPRQDWRPGSPVIFRANKC